MPLPRIAIATGDPAGIGPEIALKAALDARVTALMPALAGGRSGGGGTACAGGRPVAALARDRQSRRRRLVGRRGQPARCQRRHQYAGASSARSMPLTAAPRSPAPAARSKPRSPATSMPWWRRRRPNARFTAAGIAFDGYPSFVARETGTPVNDVYLMICFDDVRIAHATLHVSVREAVALITPERVERVIRVTNAALKQLGIAHPKIFVGGLNPHAGEDGMFGREEIEIIIAGHRARGQGWHRGVRPVRRRHHVPQERLRRIYRHAARPGPHRRQAAGLQPHRRPVDRLADPVLVGRAWQRARHRRQGRGRSGRA